MNKKLLAWLAALGAAAGVTVAITTHGGRPGPGPSRPPSSPAVYAVTVHVFEGDPSKDEKRPGAHVTVVGTAIAGEADGAGNVTLSGVAKGPTSVCADLEGFAQTCTPVTVPDDGDVNLSLARVIPPHDDADTPLTTQGPIFLKADAPWRYKGISAFKLLELWRTGGAAAVDQYLDVFPGYNVARVWLYAVVGGDFKWEPPDVDVALQFAAHLRERGWYIEFTLLTDDDPGRIPWAKRFVQALTAARPPNVLLEAGNEPTTNKHIDTPALRSTLAGSGFQYSSGDYEDSARFYGTYLTAHTGRDGEWPRRAHDMLEYFAGGGPGAPSDPAHKVPGVCDEPIKPYQAPGATRDKDYLAYFAACSLMGAGATFHFQSGLLTTPPTDEERHYAAIALQGLNAFPPDAPRGGYRRIDENGRSSRTYAIGNYLVRIRPTTPEAPESGWAPIDDGGVLWTRR